MNYELLGSRLKQERLKMNLTQEKLAEKVEVSHAYIGQIERGERSLTLDTLVRLANCLGVTVDYLLSDELEKNGHYYTDKVKQLMQERSSDEQQLIYEILDLMFTRLDKLNSKE